MQLTLALSDSLPSLKFHDYIFVSVTKFGLLLGKFYLGKVDCDGESAIIQNCCQCRLFWSLVLGQTLDDGWNSKESPSMISDFQLGQVVADRYRIDKVLGRGGMGIVYKVEQIFLRRTFAIKTLDIANASEIAWRRFQKEAETVSRLDHPNIIRIHDFGLIDEKQPFYVMDFVEGESLDERVKRIGPLKLEEALSSFIKVAFALAHAHANGVIHRDIKPSNIMFGCSGAAGDQSVKIVDFGISKLLSEGSESQNLTRVGEIFGSPLYMSPEQCTGTSIDHRTDIYSFGCAMFDALTGCPPHVGDSTLSTMMKHRVEEPPSLREASLGKNFPESVELLLRKLLEKNPDQRYQSFEQVAADLIAIESGRTPASKVTIVKAPKIIQLPASEKLPMLSLVSGRTFAVLLTVVVAVAASFYVHQNNSKIAQAALAVSTRNRDEETVVENKSLLHSVPNSQVNAFYKSGALSKRTEMERSYKQSKTFSTICLESSGQKVRVFQFPEDFCLGTIVVETSQVRAQGDVLLPTLKPFEFVASYKCCERPSLFSKFRDDEISDLDMRGVETASDDVLSYLSNWKQLHSLNLEVTEVTDRGLKYLDGCSNLRELILDNTEVTGGGLASFKGLKSLEKLRAGLIPDSWKVISALKNSEQILELRLWQTHLNDENIQDIGTLKNLEYLDIAGNTGITDKGLRSLSHLSKLQFIKVCGCKLTAGCIATLKTLPSLEELSVTRNQFDAVTLNKIKTALPKLKVTYERQLDL